MTHAFSLLVLSLSSLELFTGCQTQVPSRTTDLGYTAPKTQPAQSTQWRGATTSAPVVNKTPKFKAAPAKSSSDVIFKTNQISVTKTVLEAASLGGRAPWLRLL
ncbi:MAG: hypothetical protein ABF329_08350 [Lentimonas sp.]